MNNISQKIIILFTAVAIAVTGVLVFIPSIVKPPQEIEYVNLHNQEIMDNVDKFSTSLSFNQNDSTYEGIIMRFKIYENEAYLTNTERDDLMASMVSKFVPVFISQSGDKFTSRVWYPADHQTMKTRIASLRNLSFAESSAPVLSNNHQVQLTSILNVIADYEAANNLADNARYLSNSSAIGMINKADEYSGRVPLNNCIALVEKLGEVKAKIAESHFNKLNTEINRLKRYKNISQDDFTTRLATLLEQVNEYESMSPHYSYSMVPADTLRNRASRVEEKAMEWYTRHQTQVYTNGEWEETSQSGGSYRVFRSTYNYGVHGRNATMYFTISGQTSFTFEIASDAESGYDYVMVGKGYRPSTDSYDYSTSDSNGYYKTITYNYLDPSTTYTIYVVYRKDGSNHRGNDRGYLRIPNSNE